MFHAGGKVPTPEERELVLANIQRMAAVTSSTSSCSRNDKSVAQPSKPVYHPALPSPETDSRPQQQSSPDLDLSLEQPSRPYAVTALGSVTNINLAFNSSNAPRKNTKEGQMAGSIKREEDETETEQSRKTTTVQEDLAEKQQDGRWAWIKRCFLSACVRAWILGLVILIGMAAATMMFSSSSSTTVSPPPPLTTDSILVVSTTPFTPPHHNNPFSQLTSPLTPLNTPVETWRRILAWSRDCVHNHSAAPDHDAWIKDMQAYMEHLDVVWADMKPGDKRLTGDYQELRRLRDELKVQGEGLREVAAQQTGWLWKWLPWNSSTHPIININNLFRRADRPNNLAAILADSMTRHKQVLHDVLSDTHEHIQCLCGTSDALCKAFYAASEAVRRSYPDMQQKLQGEQGRGLRSHIKGVFVTGREAADVVAAWERRCRRVAGEVERLGYLVDNRGGGSARGGALQVSAYLASLLELEWIINMAMGLLGRMAEESSDA